MMALFLIATFLGSCQSLGSPINTEDFGDIQTEQATGITMAEIVHANSTVELLKQYDSFHITYTYNGEYGYEYYADDTMVFTMDNTSRALYVGTDCVYWENDAYTRVLYAGIEPDTEWYHWLTLNAYTSLWGTVKNVSRDGGKLYVNTVLPAKYMNDIYYEEDGLAAVLTDYVLDADTYVILESTTTYKYIDGYRLIVETHIQTDVEVPDLADELASHMNATTDTRSFTIILNPDTSKETSYSVTLPKEDYVEFYYPNDYTELYLDRACTQKATPEDLETQKDLILYAKALYPEAETAGSF